MRNTVFLILALTITVSFAQDCNNPLIDKCGISEPLSTPIVVDGLKYCKNLQDGTARSCCDPSFISSIQANQDIIRDQLQDISGKRDKYIKSMEKYINTLRAAAQNFTNIIQKCTNTTLTSIMTTAAQSTVDFANNLVNSIGSLKTNFPDFQKKRSKCFSRLVRLQGAVFCLACDSNYVDRGVAADGSITIGSNTCSKLQNDCQPYLVAANQQGQLVTLAKAADILQGYTNVTADLCNLVRPIESKTRLLRSSRSGGSRSSSSRSSSRSSSSSSRSSSSRSTSSHSSTRTSTSHSSSSGSTIRSTSTTRATTSYTSRTAYYSTLKLSRRSTTTNYRTKSVNSRGVPDIDTAFVPDDDSQQPAYLPAGCESVQTCAWVCNNAINDGFVVVQAFATGGEPNEQTASVRLLEKRSLQVYSTWEPEENEAGTDATVDTDPGGIYKSSWRMTSVMAILALFAMLFI